MSRTWKRSLTTVVAAACAGLAGLVGAAGVAGAASAAGSPAAAPAPEPSGTISVTGTGTVTVDPDTAVVTLGVQATAATGAEAMEQLTTDSNALADALTAAGIAAEDVQTSGLNLWSTYGDDGITVTGYQASLNVNVTVRDIAAVGSTIDAAQAAAGPGFTINGVSFSFSDPESVLQQARIDAVANARTIAQQYADAAGVELGAVVSIVDSSTSGVVPIMFGRADMAAAAPQSVAINPGTLDLDVTISVTFATS